MAVVAVAAAIVVPLTAPAGPAVAEAGATLTVATAEGNGPVNALDGALRKALERHYPRLREMQLVDYKVRVINARAGTAARVRVVIESKDLHSVWGTVGVSENVIEASWLALVDAFAHKLSKDARGTTTAPVPRRTTAGRPRPWWPSRSSSPPRPARSS